MENVPDGYVRYCPHCGHIGEIDPKFRDCCPDGSSAMYVTRDIAEQAKMGFNKLLFNVLTSRRQSGGV